MTSRPMPWRSSSWIRPATSWCRSHPRQSQRIPRTRTTTPRPTPRSRPKEQRAKARTSPPSGPSGADAAKKALDGIKAVEKRLTQPKFTHETDRLKLPAGLDVKLSAVPEVVVSADNAPTRQTREVFAKPATEADEALAEIERLVGDE